MQCALSNKEDLPYKVTIPLFLLSVAFFFQGHHYLFSACAVLLAIQIANILIDKWGVLKNKLFNWIGDEIINFAYEQGKEPAIIKVKRIGDDRSGTGDVISGVIAGSYLNGLNFYQCVEKAANFASRCIEYSQAVGAHNHLGLCFEPFLKEL